MTVINQIENATAPIVASSDVGYQTGLFTAVTTPPSSPAAATTRISARRAFQHALHGYAMLIDIRPQWVREQAGVLDPELATLTVDVSDLGWLSRSLGGLPPILICQNGNASVRLAAALQRTGVSEVSDVIGGFGAWQAAGLPVRTIRSGSTN